LVIFFLHRLIQLFIKNIHIFGLGLIIVYQQLTKLNSKLECRSINNQGTTFSFNLDLHDINNDNNPSDFSDNQTSLFSYSERSNSINFIDHEMTYKDRHIIIENNSIDNLNKEVLVIPNEFCKEEMVQFQ
jgi:hypothetical protein